MYKSRQLISHGSVSVNGKVVRNPGTNLTQLDIIEIDANLFKNEAADLLFHLLVLFYMKQIKLEDIEAILLMRSKKS